MVLTLHITYIRFFGLNLALILFPIIQKNQRIQENNRILEIARLQDFAPNTQGLLGALSGPQTPCRIERTPHWKFLPTGLLIFYNIFFQRVTKVLLASGFGKGVLKVRLNKISFDWLFQSLTIGTGSKKPISSSVINDLKFTITGGIQNQKNWERTLKIILVTVDLDLKSRGAQKGLRPNIATFDISKQKFP